MLMLNLDKIKPGVISMFQVNMGLKKGESVLVVNDVPRSEEWYLSFSEIKEMTQRSIFARGIYEICRETFKGNKVDYLVYP